MPKERIHGLPGDRYTPVVGWANDQDVQLGITTDGTSLLRALYGDTETRARIGQQVSNLVAANLAVTEANGKPDDADLGGLILDCIESVSTADGVDPYHSLWSHLTRQAINHLIRTLRRARDAAYGRDE